MVATWKVLYFSVSDVRTNLGFTNFTSWQYRLFAAGPRISNWCKSSFFFYIHQYCLSHNQTIKTVIIPDDWSKRRVLLIIFTVLTESRTSHPAVDKQGIPARAYVHCWMYWIASSVNKALAAKQIHTAVMQFYILNQYLTSIASLSLGPWLAWRNILSPSLFSGSSWYLYQFASVPFGVFAAGVSQPLVCPVGFTCAIRWYDGKQV